ncbi:MAG: type IV pilus modification protein PilV [Oceanospirillaceae bacterium]|nr:type IV pilus modification protein PilV [Oceanospirillaceae bacterium]MCP5334571.1 type IV pilus modification protein PilV [Oceanospirillaceae bacterium]MCP5351395.1 type IV pilus modification protein PilV [Oceanospirillaceae bacterium]
MMRIKQQKGVTLLEVLLTIFISGVGLMGLAALQLRAIQATNDSSQNSQGMWVLLDLVGRIQVNTTAASTGAYVTDLKGSTFCDAANAPAKMCATYYNSGTIAGQSCSGDELARFDLWDTLCGTSRDGTTIGHQAWNLVEPELTITCTIVGVKCQHYDLNLSWNNQNDQTQSNSASFELELPL